MAIKISGSGLSVIDVVNVARSGEKVELAPGALERIEKCRGMLEKKIKAKEIMYGVNTGIGEFSEVVLDDNQIKDFQKYLIYNHAAGIGDPAPIEYVRAAMLGRINVHAHGNSGCRPEITLTLVEMLNKGVTPFVCQKGSVGACGDLAPMAQIALLLMGEGKAYYKGELLEGKEAMDRAGIPIPGLEARDGLATINGSNLLTGMSALFLYDATNWLKQAEIAAAMSLEALKANMKPYSAKLHEARGFIGAVRSAAAIRKCVEGGDLYEGKIKCKVQDAYSMRSTPQVIGAAHDALAFARSQVEIELAGFAADGPRRGRRHNGQRHVGTSHEQAEQPGPERRLAGVPHQGRGDVLRPHVEPVHRRLTDSRTTHPVEPGLHPIHPRSSRPGRFRFHGHEHRDKELPNHR